MPSLARAAKASTRTVTGASFNCRTSQFTRVVGLPSRGASTSKWHVILLALRLACTSSGATALGIRMDAVMAPVFTNEETSVFVRVAGLAASSRDKIGVTSAPSFRPSWRQANRIKASNRPATSTTLLSVWRSVPAATASRTSTQFGPMSSNESAPDLGCSRYRINSPRIHAWSGSATPRNSFCITA